MSDFVDECLREWRRLGVPDPIANEMAADLGADIAEAEAEGGSAEDVLGTSAFDPRRFAASWATARGVTTPVSDAPVTTWWRAPVVTLAFVVVLVACAGAVVVAVLVRGHGSSIARSPWNVLPGPAHPPSSWFNLGPFHAMVNGPGFGPPLLLLGVLALGALVVVGLAVGLVTAHLVGRAPRTTSPQLPRSWPRSRAGS